MTVRLLALVLLVVCGCAARPAQPPLDAYTGAGPLRVRGARDSEPGPEVVRALAGDPAVRRVLVARGDPETVEVVHARGRGRRAVLTYREPGGRLRRVVFESPVDPGRAPPHARPTARSAVAQGVPARPAVVAGPPTRRQELECPIDPGRAECRALCAGGAAHEWCR
jgi:hypothetical protein